MSLGSFLASISLCLMFWTTALISPGATMCWTRCPHPQKRRIRPQHGRCLRVATKSLGFVPRLRSTGAFAQQGNGRLTLVLRSFRLSCSEPSHSYPCLSAFFTRFTLVKVPIQPHTWHTTWNRRRLKSTAVYRTPVCTPMLEPKPRSRDVSISSSDHKGRRRETTGYGFRIRPQGETTSGDHGRPRRTDSGSGQAPSGSRRDV